MLIKLVGGVVLGAIVGAGIGIGVSASGVLDPGTATTSARFADVFACPSAEGAIGRLPAGQRVLLTAVGPDSLFYEIHYPLSPNNHAWISAALVDPDEATNGLPVQACRPVLAVTSLAPTASPTAAPTATATLTTPSPTPTSTATAAPTPTATATAVPTPAPTAEPTPPPTPRPTRRPPTPTPTPTPTLPPDTMPPTISQAAVNPSQINEAGDAEQCEPRPTTVEASAIVADAGGIDRVRVRYTLADADGETRRAMTMADGQYRAEVGPFIVDSGQVVSFTIIAVDEAGNRSEAQAGEVVVFDCGE